MIRPNRSQFDQICRLCLDGTDLVNIFERHPKTQRESLSLLVRETVEMLGLVVSTRLKVFCFCTVKSFIKCVVKIVEDAFTTDV